MSDPSASREPVRQTGGETGRPLDPTASLRSFSQNVGFLLQGFGATLFLLTTCVCCGIAFQEGDALHRGFVDTTGVGRYEAAPLLLITNVLGSLAMVAFGLGLQSDRGRFPAIGSAVATSSMTLLYGLIIMASAGPHAGGGWPAIAAGILALIMLAFSVLTWMAAAQVLRHPPLSSEAPTVPADAFPDPLARPRQRYDSPAQGDIAKRRKQLEQEMRDLDDLEQEVQRQNRNQP